MQASFQSSILNSLTFKVLHKVYVQHKSLYKICKLKETEISVGPREKVLIILATSEIKVSLHSLARAFAVLTHNIWN